LKKFLVHVVQGEGCDYTIGCGHSVEYISADTIEKAKDIWWEEFCDGRELDEESLAIFAEGGTLKQHMNYMREEYDYESVTFMELGPEESSLNMRARFKLIEESVTSIQKKVDLNQDEAEFERLKKKLNK
jgi:hypothetical protein